MRHNDVSIGTPLYFYQITPEGPLVGEWVTCTVTGEHEQVWLVSCENRVYAVDKTTLVSERTAFYTQKAPENEPKGRYALSESLRQFFMANRHHNMPYPQIRQMYELVNNHLSGVTDGS
ncbi:conserved hypothetical protein [Vibrio nigripulchritudo SOn1]|uniref:Uncharacterized protein n=1 Tax=Vibrio nigripulchritudo SOn1 TaxID=1238450 RepID=A0AAV2VPI6_9VIBR|nr:hypothetical protein [Vibrio nigripulchritudo]CCO46635.1 conserved hypothetical protein [Vibrio nigripulchritudo SOn1]